MAGPTCDLDRIVVRTSFTNTATETHTIHLAELAEPTSLDLLRAVFHHPDKLKPGLTSQLVTERAARKIAEIAARLHERQKSDEPTSPPKGGQLTFATRGWGAAGRLDLT